MTLYDACDIGYLMGCETIEECVINVQVHAMELFAYDDITDELMELHNEIKAKGYKGHESIELIVKKDRQEELDNFIQQLACEILEDFK